MMLGEHLKQLGDEIESQATKMFYGSQFEEVKEMIASAVLSTSFYQLKKLKETVMNITRAFLHKFRYKEFTWFVGECGCWQEQYTDTSFAEKGVHRFKQRACSLCLPLVHLRLSLRKAVYWNVLGTSIHPTTTLYGRVINPPRSKRAICSAVPRHPTNSLVTSCCHCSPYACHPPQELPLYYGLFRPHLIS